MLFLGMANAYVMRTNMSVAIVAMVNHTYVNEGNVEIIDDECPDTNYTIVVSMIIFNLSQFNGCGERPHTKPSCSLIHERRGKPIPGNLFAGLD